MKHNRPRIEMSDIEDQARKIRDIAQRILDTSQSGKGIDRYARNIVTGGTLAQDAAVLGIYIVAYEMQEDK